MRGATLAVGAMIAVMFMGSTIVTPLYSLYAQHFGFSVTVLTLIYAAYVIGNLVSLFFFGGVSDYAGRRRIVLRAMAAAALSAAIYLFATNTAWLFAARVLSGFSIGLAAGAGTAWIAELDAEDKTRATLVRSAYRDPSAHASWRRPSQRSRSSRFTASTSPWRPGY